MIPPTLPVRVGDAAPQPTFDRRAIAQHERGFGRQRAERPTLEFQLHALNAPVLTPRASQATRCGVRHSPAAHVQWLQVQPIYLRLGRIPLHPGRTTGRGEPQP